MQLIDGVELDQRGVILHALVGQPGRRQKGLAEREQWFEELAAFHLLAQLAIAEVLRFVLEDADPVHAFIGLEKSLQLPLDLPGQPSAEQASDAQMFSGDGPPHQVLQIGVAGGDDSLMDQVL